MDPRRADLEAETLYEISKVLSLSTDLNKAFTAALNLLGLYLGMENGTLSLFDPVTGEVFIEAAPEMRDEERILGRLQPGEGLVGRIFSTGMPVVVPDIAHEPLFLNRTGTWRDLTVDPRAFIGVPVQDGRAVLGVLTVDRPHRSGPIEFGRDVRFLSMLALQIGARVRLMQLESPHRRAAQDLPSVAAEPERFPGVVGRSARMQEILQLVARVARSRATVLVRGESGTGKELIAHALHEASPRAGRPFVALNCAALPETLIESELFGHEKGAFTGAAASRPGRFEQADGGTLFLDEVGELSLAAQAKLLRALQERQFERIGGRRVVTVDVRLVAATNRNLEQVARELPDLTLCLSTNGLALPDHADRLADLGVRHVTVTVNMVDPAVGERIYPWVIWRGRKVRGQEASRLLSERQLEGLARLRERGVLCKVNSVVIPGVNDGHLPEVGRRLRALGVFLHNVMPLLSAPEHGTHYGLSGQRGPSDAELEVVRRACELDAKVMRHCRQCRADAVGLLGQDRSAEFTMASLPPEPAQDAPDVRAAHRAAVERVHVCVAVATKGGGLVNEHFGHAREFLVYEADRLGARLLATRRVERSCQGGEGEEDALAAALRALADCRAVLVAKVGRCPQGQLAAAGIEPVWDVAHQPIEAAVLGWFASFAGRVARGEAVPTAPPVEPARPPALRAAPQATEAPLAAAG